MTEEEDDCLTEEIENHKPLSYYVMNNGCVEKDNSVFDRPNEGMKQHLKSLFIWAKVDGVGVNKVLVDGGAVINVMPNSLLRRTGKKGTDLRLHNMILCDYKGKMSNVLGVIKVNIAVGTIVRPTLFVVISPKKIKIYCWVENGYMV